jgi:hypothetical protein
VIRLSILCLLESIIFRALSTSLRVSHACRVARARPRSRPRIVVRDGCTWIEGGGVVARVGGDAWNEAVAGWMQKGGRC